MGATNVGHVLRNWHCLPPRARVVLIAMAHASSDDERQNGGKACRYFGGPAYLAEVLYGRAGVEQGPDGHLVPTESAGRQVRKVLTDLVSRGALRRVTVGGNHHKAEYEIVLAPPAVRGTETVLRGSASGRASGGPKRSGRGGPVDNLRGTETVPVRGTKSVLSGGPKRSSQGDQIGPPQEKEEEAGIGEEEDHPPAPQDRARAEVGADPEDSSPAHEHHETDRPAPPAADPVTHADRHRRLADTPLTDDETREYEQASHALRARLGDIPATEAVLAHAAKHGLDPMRATIELARPPRSAA